MHFYKCDKLNKGLKKNFHLENQLILYRSNIIQFTKLILRGKDYSKLSTAIAKFLPYVLNSLHYVYGPSRDCKSALKIWSQYVCNKNSPLSHSE